MYKKQAPCQQLNGTIAKHAQWRTHATTTRTHWYKRSLKAELPEPREYESSHSPENAATPLDTRER